MKGCELVVIYADILFAINFSMDFLSLFICSMILKRKTSRWRIIVGSLIGALYGVIDVVLGLNKIFSVILCIIFSFVMCVVSFWGVKLRGLLTSTALLLGVGAALGGTMSLIYSFMNKIFAGVIEKIEPTTSYNGARFFLIASITAIVSIIFARVFLREKENKVATLRVEYDGTEYKFEGLVDSGNKLRDPLSQKPVILLSGAVALAQKIKIKDDKYKRFIPYGDVSGKGILKGVMPKKIYVNDALVDGIICVSERADFSGYNALIPSCLL